MNIKFECEFEIWMKCVSRTSITPANKIATVRLIFPIKRKGSK
jgi:hypothetical protein